MKKITTIGLDLAKSAVQVHAVADDGKCRDPTCLETITGIRVLFAPLNNWPPWRL